MGLPETDISPHHDGGPLYQGAGAFLPGRVLAAPSWVFPASMAENCRFLAGRVDEVGLLFFESAASMAYGSEDLPPFLAELPLRYHLHLPADLPMHAPEEAAGICHSLFLKTAFLGPLRGVLHPPPNAQGGAKCLVSFLDAFIALGTTPDALLLENTKESDLCDLEGVIEDYGLRICLDMGHALAYGQNALLEHTALLQRAGMIHVNAPGRGGAAGRHVPLTSLSPQEAAAAERMLCAVPNDAVIMMELFAWPDIEASLPLVRQWLAGTAT